MIDNALAALLDCAAEGGGRIVCLTGAGISAESGIPTFRGEEGYWTVGAREYRPQELATWAMFSANPEWVWPWYLYRRGVCRGAAANRGHIALFQLEEALGDRFVLVTQNVDGLHIRAGNTLERSYQIHGNIDYMRCASACRSESTLPLREVPDVIGAVGKGEAFQERWRAALTCSECGGWMRPHVLWFDECYNEEWYRFESALAATAQADLLITVGTSGATNLPMMMARIAAEAGVPIVDVNPEPNPFSRYADQNGAFVQQAAGAALPRITQALIEAWSVY